MANDTLGSYEMVMAISQDTINFQFEKLFKRPVDLVTEKSLKNPYFINSVNQTKQQIYGH